MNEVCDTVPNCYDHSDENNCKVSQGVSPGNRYSNLSLTLLTYFSYPAFSYKQVLRSPSYGIGHATSMLHMVPEDFRFKWFCDLEHQYITCSFDPNICFPLSGICQYDHDEDGDLIHCQDGSHLGVSIACKNVDCSFGYKCESSYCIPI